MKFIFRYDENLANLMIEHGVRVRSARTEVTRLDEDFFVEG
ncbi:hypothetical protein [Rhizobium sp. CSW-27]|nr:hypothetical protein [Rhizobium sp. CSW-27]